MSVSVVVGNPKARSRTWDAAHRVAGSLGLDVGHSDLVDLGPRLLDWSDEAVSGELKAVRSSKVVIVSSPTYKATFTSLLHLFLERFETGQGLSGVVAVPLMLGGSLAHSLAPEFHLKPLLSELGASCPTAALYLLDSATQQDDRESAWLERWGGTVRAALG